MTTLNGMALVLSAGAAYMDLKYTRVDNLWILIWAAAGTAVRFHNAGPPVWISVFAGMFFPFIFLLPFFYLRMIGAGDIKVLMAFGCMTGLRDILYGVLFSFLIGAVLAAVIFLIYGGFRQRLLYCLNYTKEYLQSGQKKPYLRDGVQSESLHMTYPIFLAVLLWIGGI